MSGSPVPEPVPATVTRMLTSLRHFVDQAPPLTAELEVLERSLAPVEAWALQWNHLRSSLVGTLAPAPPPDA